MLVKKIILSTLLTLFVAPLYADNKDIVLPESMQVYIKSISNKYHFNQEKLTQLFSHAKINQGLLSSFQHAAEKKPWYQYRSIFISQHRIQNGVTFWQQHHKVLAEAEQQYHVPASIIVALLGIESHYGKRQGNIPVFSTLTTLAFYYPAREQFFRQELTQYLLLTREQHLPTLTMTGSYAGAIGIPQFMPSTYRRYAVDYSQQDSANLVDNIDDTIVSVANYLQKMGWQANKPIAIALTPQHIPENLVSSKIAKPTETIAQLKKQGVTVPKHSDTHGKATIVKLQQSENPATYQYWLTFNNFATIMRYNVSINYAMTAYQLSEAIEHEYQRAATTTSTNITPAR